MYFLKANVRGQEIRLGAWGYCSASGCTKTTLGYSLGELSCPAARSPLTEAPSRVARGFEGDRTDAHCSQTYRTSSVSTAWTDST